ncbi:hypothetical protein FEM48_Zijuj10G0010300 [Ziziphus jujuba var. spinosa]|uniref:Uncharacterized protein n=1 Tax=Ziziphus jujuba var. spinosa TaxID=714518 RepID=A0A978UKD0_ZIZJJ|nr:hypothetical protein FEM48_Zijuj10G0010300 [Ziziphus jujuba var. spinosa]
MGALSVFNVKEKVITRQGAGAICPYCGGPILACCYDSNLLFFFISISRKIKTNDISLEGLRQELEEFKNDDVVANILSKGTKLREYTKGVENNIWQVGQDLIRDYIKESDNLVSLHDQIRDCESILSQVETFLRGLQVNDEYIRTLETLSKKLKFVDADPMVKISKGLKNVQPELEKLLQKAVSKVNFVLYPHLTIVFDMHLNSLCNANVQAMWEEDVRPYYVMRRYAELTASLIHINDHTI